MTLVWGAMEVAGDLFRITSRIEVSSPGPTIIRQLEGRQLLLSERGVIQVFSNDIWG